MSEGSASESEDPRQCDLNSENILSLLLTKTQLVLDPNVTYADLAPLQGVEQPCIIVFH